MNIQQFTYEPARNVRAILNDKGEPLFLAKDVCQVLEITDTQQAVERLDEDEKLMRTVHVSGQNRQAWFVTESGLYSLIFTSRKPEAKAFKKWVTSVLLPTLRKTGKIELTDKNIRRNMLPEVQVQNARQVNNANFRQGGVQLVKNHNTEIEKAITGKAPSEWRAIGKQKGYPSKIYNSGKQVIRKERPADACCISTADDLVKEGYSLAQAIEIAKAFKSGFQKSIDYGIVPHELTA
jgi:prophage antirepressor-like protein